MSCKSVPTETQFAAQVVTTNSLSTSFSLQVTTQPPVLSTSIATTCLDNPPGPGPCATPSTSITVITSPGSTSTNSIPVIITVPVTQTTSNPTRTLFSTSCGPVVPQTTTTPSSAAASTASSLSDSALSTTGSIVTTDVVLSSLSPTSVVVTATPTFNKNRGGPSSSKVAPIVGGVFGGVIGLIAVIGGIWYLWRRTRRWNDIFDRETDEKEHRRRMSLGEEDVQPRPYHYGLVGHSASPTPPSSPPLRATPSGHSPSNSLSMLNGAVRVHSRESSALDPSIRSISRSGSDLSPTPVGHIRHNLSTTSSTAASTVPLLERPVNSPRPHSSGSPSAEVFDSRGRQAPTIGPRPHSAGDKLPSGAAAAAIPGAASTSSFPSNWASPVSEKTERRKLRKGSLPMGAAPPTIPSPIVPPIPAPEPSASRTAPPPLKPRSPRRPSSATPAEVLVHVDDGPIPGPSQPDDEPPVYSPT